MTVTTIILSKDRPAQLDLLLQSLERNSGGQFDWRVLWKGERLDEAYDGLLWQQGRFAREGEEGFEWMLRALLNDAGQFACFMCDDGILYRHLPTLAPLDHDVLCLSLRLGANTTICYPSGLPQRLPTWDSLTRFGNSEPLRKMWRWANEPSEPGVSDFGYPGSIDGHIFRTADVRRMLEGKTFPNPTALECALVDGCNELAEERPLMACYPHSVYVGNPVNRVSEQSGVRFGQTYPITAEECNQRFMAGERIDLGALDFSGVTGAHTEIELKWSLPST